jgi:hypothetical protein
MKWAKKGSRGIGAIETPDAESLLFPAKTSPQNKSLEGMVLEL